MTWLEITISVIAAIGLFTHSLEGFSKNLRQYAESKLKGLISRMSDTRIKGLLFGFVATAVIQSSSAVIAILVSLTDAGVISFSHTLPVLLGSNLGTTVTAWLVSFKLQGLGITLLAIGFILGYFRGAVRFIGKPIFYIGLILFSLELISEYLLPLKESQVLVELLQHASNPLLGILIGATITAVCQSSSVAIGLVVILSGQGILGLDSAIAIIVGSNIGTTTTAFLASMNLGASAKKTAEANLVFNVIGLLIYLPLAKPFVNLVRAISNDPSYQVAMAHLIFNLVIALTLIPFTGKIAGRLNQWHARAKSQT